jgi:hypothetical protein
MASKSLKPFYRKSISSSWGWSSGWKVWIQRRPLLNKMPYCSMDWAVNTARFDSLPTSLSFVRLPLHGSKNWNQITINLSITMTIDNVSFFRKKAMTRNDWIYSLRWYLWVVMDNKFTAYMEYSWDFYQVMWHFVTKIWRVEDSNIRRSEIKKWMKAEKNDRLQY